MRLCLIRARTRGPEGKRATMTLYQWATALHEQGHQVTWLTSDETLEALRDSVPDAEDTPAALPATCQHVIPCQAFTLAGIELLCATSDVWQHADRHTRLFTFLTLLHRVRSWDVLHAWDALAVLYLATYTARVLAVPPVVTYGQDVLAEGPQQPFLWTWVAQHVAHAVQTQQEQRTRLLACSALPLECVAVIAPTAATALAALYQCLAPAPRL